MDNRFQNRSRPDPQANRFTSTAVAASMSRPQAQVPGLDLGAAYGLSAWSQGLSANDRSLVILIESGGVDLGIPELVDKLMSALPGLDQIPSAYKRVLVNVLREKIKSFTDNLIESAELTLNRYQAAKPDYFGSVVVLRNGTASYDELKKQLLSLSRAGRIVDLLILTHGGDDSISVTGGISGQRIRDMRTELGKALSIRSVYMMNCVGSSLNQAWIDAGAKTSSGAIRNNYLPEPTTYFFWQAWKAGQSFDTAVTSAYRKTIALMNEVVRSFISDLPFPLSQLASLVNFADMDFVKDSAPVVQGDGSLTIGSDNLVFTKSLSRGPALAMTVLPVGTLRAIAAAQSDASPAHAAYAVSPQGIAFIKARTPFHAQPYDELGYCAIGYGTPLHHGPCDGRAEEQRYAAGITEDAAMQLLVARVRHCEDALNDCVRVSLNPNQVDALASFMFSLGHKRFRESTLLRLLNEGQYAAVPVELRKWTKAGRDGAVVDVPELVDRRNAEAELFLKPVPGAAQSLTDTQGLLRRRWAQAYSGDIPLDPGSGGRSIGADALQNGDIIVTTRNGPISSVIRNVTGAPVSHAILYIGNGQVVEAIGNGVTLRSLEQALAGCTVAVAFRDPALTPEAALKVRDYAGRMLDRPFNTLGLVRQGGFQLDRATFCSGKSGAAYDQCVNWVGNVNLGRGGDDSFFCSQLVVAAFQDAGVPLTNTPPNWTSPSDLADLGMARRLGYVGHLLAPAVNAPASAPTLQQSLSLMAPPERKRTVIMQSLATPFGFAATEWEPLISFRPPTAVQTAVKGKGVNWHVHHLEDAHGDISLDYYPITVNTLPVVGGRTLSAEEFLAYIRLNINRFVDTRISEFSPYDGGEAVVWNSGSPLGSVVHIEMKAFGGWINPDDGSVVVAEAAPDHWIFSTIWTVMDMAHPVSGNRQFGYTPADGGGYLFYTRGADRTTGLLDLAAMSMVYSSAHNLWLSFQNAVAAFVNSQGGSATAGSATSIRTPWPDVKASSHHPSVGWV
jgi:GH24 family phage-related lysozyme (muramidase)/uncharacterized protein YycO